MARHSRSTWCAPFSSTPLGFFRRTISFGGAQDERSRKVGLLVPESNCLAATIAEPGSIKLARARWAESTARGSSAEDTSESPLKNMKGKVLFGLQELRK
jgi:hypothetical protein